MLHSLCFKPMRISEEQVTFLKQSIQSVLPNSNIYLFGSRIKDDQKGGDIDILIISDRKLTNQEKRDIKIGFYKRFGEQKIDLVSFREDDPSNFKKIALTEGIKL